MLKHFSEDEMKSLNFIKKYGYSNIDSFNVEKNELKTILTSGGYFVDICSLSDKKAYSMDYSNKITLKNILLCFDNSSYSCFLLKINLNIYKENDLYHLGIIKKANAENFFDEKVYYSAKKVENFLNINQNDINNDERYFQMDNIQLNPFFPFLENFVLENHLTTNVEIKNKIKI